MTDETASTAAERDESEQDAASPASAAIAALRELPIGRPVITRESTGVRFKEARQLAK